MKKIILLILLGCLGNFVAQAQTNSEAFTVVETMPEFIGGDKALNDYLDKNLTYPAQAKKQNIQGKVWVGFIVGQDGTISDAEILRGIGGGCDEEALRVIKNMPKWKPGTQDGKPVAVKFRFPINFMLR